MADHPHFLIQESKTSHPYSWTGARGPDASSPPKPNRVTHSQKLAQDLERAEKKAKSRRAKDPAFQGMQFIPLRFDQGSDFDLQVKSLENKHGKIRILSARVKDGVAKYLVAVPDDQVEKFAKKFRDYGDESKTTSTGKPLNEPLAIGIGKIISGDLEDYLTDASESVADTSKTVWWEVWLDVFESDSAMVEAWFRKTANEQKIRVSDQKIEFPDRIVILAFTSFEKWNQFPQLLSYLAELRTANIVASEYTVSLPPAEQGKFVADLAKRICVAPSDSPCVTVLDGGVDRGHPLLEASLSEADTQAWEEDWGSSDDDGHGTEMAGACLFGDSLNDHLATSDPVPLALHLESVKVVPNEGENSPPDYGPITVGSMALAEIASPDSQRIFCMAVTATSDDQWRPTLWSASIDQATSGATDGNKRLMVVSAGNLREDLGANYPRENYLSSVEDPSQAWNALTIGAFTKLAWIEEEGLEDYTPIAMPGTLSPASRTSMSWADEPWPYKPDVVFEGGNYAKNSGGIVTATDDLSTLTTQSSKFSDSLLGVTRDTSGATALASNMAGTLQSEYPNYWPETIRGLIVHSAEWTPEMLDEFPHADRKSRLRVYGMGVPDIQRARWTTSGFCTMVIQDEIQPFSHPDSSNEMNLHDLPIPQQVLSELGNTPVRMRVTLSYFIEPNPPRRGLVAQHQYASHGLRFSVRRGETIDALKRRLSRKFWDRDDNDKEIRPPSGSNATDEREWALGPEVVAVRGSIHSDYWTGTAAQLALSNHIAIYPVTGWWRLRSDPKIVEQNARYSLCISISTDDEKVDLQAMVANEIKTRIEAKTTVEATKIEI